MIQIQWTCASAEEARKIAYALVEKKLAACVNILPTIESIYLWKEKVETSSEVKVFIKTVKELFPQVSRYIGEHCNYEVPEILFFEVDAVTESYEEWLKNVCGPPSR
jgi:periplasmic divalent cation tolerance protein